MCADRVTTAVRSRIMASIGSKDTKPELTVRSLLHRRGFRFRLHRKDLPGKPDLVFPRHRAVIFVHGCFWHGHDCHLFSMPKSRADFWQQKIGRNKERDAAQQEMLAEVGWRVALVWECALMGRSLLHIGVVGERCAKWLQSDEALLELRGRELVVDCENVTTRTTSSVFATFALHAVRHNAVNHRVGSRRIAASPNRAFAASPK